MTRILFAILLVCISLVSLHAGRVLLSRHILDAPIANDDFAVTFQNISVFISVLSNDEGSNLSVQIITMPQHGMAIVAANNAISYAPTMGYTGSDSFIYRLTDTQTGNSDIATVTVNVQQSNNPINAFDDIAQTNEGQSVSIPVLQNDAGTGISLTAIAALPTHGTASINGNQVVYVPQTGFIGNDQFAYQISNLLGNTDIASITVSVLPNNTGQNNPPYEVFMEFCGAPMQPIVICNPFTDPDGDDTWINLDESNSTFHCSLTALGSDSCFRYTPLPGFFGIDTVTVVVCDNQIPSLCSTSIVVVHVNSNGCTTPQGINDQASIAEGVFVFNGAATSVANPYNGILIGAQTNDINPCGGTPNLQVNVIITPPQHGTVQLVSGQILYDPESGYAGSDMLQYRVCNQCGLCDTATVNISIAPEQNCLLEETYCIAPFTNIELCPQFCTFSGNDIANMEVSTTAGLIQVIANDCRNFVPPALTLGNADVTFTACDNDGVCETFIAHIYIDAACGEHAPQAQDDVTQVQAGTAAIINALANDTDTDGDVLSIGSILGQPTCGTTSIQNNQIIVANNTQCNGTYQFSYTVCDPSGLCDTANISLSVVPQNTQISCSNQTEYCITPFNPTNMDYLEVCVHFCDLENAVIVDANTTFHCSISLQNDSCFTYLPLPGFTGLDTISVFGCDNTGNCDTIHLEVNVGCTLPNAQNDSAETLPATPVNIPALSNDTDPCGNTLTPNIVQQAAHGTTVWSNGQFIYTPHDGFTGIDSFIYEACSPCTIGETCDEATVNINVSAFIGNQAPQAQNDDALVGIDQAQEILVLDNDTDTDDPDNLLTVTIVEQPNNGSATPTTNGTVVYEPNAGFSGNDIFVYAVCDPQGLCDTAIVNVMVSNAVEAQPDVACTETGQAVSISLLSNDIGNALVLSSVTTLPENGAIIDADEQTGIITYMPASGFVGTDYFVYIACNPTGLCDTALVAIMVTPNNVNLPPFATTDVAEGIGTNPITIAVLLNDDDPNGDSLIVTQITQQAQYGTVSIAPNGTIVYTPTTTLPYCDAFAYMVCDNATPALCDTAFVVVNSQGATCVNEPPHAENDVVQATENTPTFVPVLANDSDPDGNIITVFPLSMPMNGTIQQIGNSLVYTSNAGFVGTDFFTYVICDNGTPALCDTASVTMTVLAQGVEAQPDIVYTMFNNAVNIPVLQNDGGTDIQVSDLNTNPQNGGLSINVLTNVITYTPNVGFTGTDYFEYTICNNEGNCDMTLVTIYVLEDPNANLPPNAINDMISTPMGMTVLIDVLNNDYDSFGGTNININNFTQPSNGTLQLYPDGTFEYTPNEGFVGQDVFSYEVCDDFEPPLCDIAQVLITINSFNLGSNQVEAVNDFGTTNMNTPLTLPIASNDQAPVAGQMLLITWVSEPANGTATINPDNISATYTPNNGFSGMDYYSYIVCNGQGFNGLCDTAYVSILVESGTMLDTLQTNLSTQEDTEISYCPQDNIGISGFVIDTVSTTQTPDNGFLLIDSLTQCLTYIPEPQFNGQDTILVLVCNLTGDCIETSIFIDVMPNNDPPVAQDDFDSTAVNTPIVLLPLANDADPDGDAITALLLVSAPTVQGAIAVYDPFAQTFTYTPAPDFWGIDSFSYIITDMQGLPSDTAWVHIFVEQAPQLPLSVLANDDTDTTLTATPTEISILDNDELPNPAQIAEIALSLVDMPEHGTANIGTETILYVPQTGFSGIDTLHYQICVTSINGETLCDTAQVLIWVDADNTPEPDNCPPLVFAGGFSPNDDLLNDLFLIENADDVCISNATLRIFNRWGDPVYVAVDYRNDKAWNGKWDNAGNNVPDATYFYVFDYLQNNEKRQVQGCMEVKR